MNTSAETSAAASAESSRADWQYQVRWLALFVLGLGLFVGVVESSVLNVATPAMQAEFSASDSEMLMLVTIFSLVFASSILFMGKIGHVFGLRRLQATGAALFGLSSLLIGLAPTIEFANAMRVFAGLGAAMGAASGLALVHGIFRGRERALAFGLWGATASLGAATGPVIGGMAVTYLSWRAAFLIVVPISLFIVFGCSRWIMEIKHEQAGSIDYLGAAIIGVGLFAITLALIYGPIWGWWTAKTESIILGISPFPWLFMVGLVLSFILFPHWLRKREAQDEEPIFDLNLLKVHSFRGGMLASFARQVAQFIPFYALGIFLEKTAGWPASETSLVFVMSAIGGMIAGSLSGWLTNRWGTKPVVILGKTLMAIAVLWMLLVTDADVNPAMLFGPFFVFGISIGLAAAQLNTVIMSDVPMTKAGDASAAKSSIGRVGNSFGAAFVGILLAISIEDVLIMALIFIVVALALAFTLPNVQGGGGSAATETHLLMEKVQERERS